MLTYGQENASTEPTLGDEKWKVGPDGINLTNLLLLGIEQVSKVGVQPILAYREVAEGHVALT